MRGPRFIWGSDYDWILQESKGVGENQRRHFTMTLVPRIMPSIAKWLLDGEESWQTYFLYPAWPGFKLQLLKVSQLFGIQFWAVKYFSSERNRTTTHSLIPKASLSSEIIWCARPFLQEISLGLESLVLLTGIPHICEHSTRLPPPTNFRNELTTSKPHLSILPSSRFSHIEKKASD